MGRVLRLSIAASIGVAVLWLFCSLFVWLAPELSAELTGHMLHMDSQTEWRLTIPGVLIGGLIWMVMVFVLVFSSAFFFERFIKQEDQL
tara:strand:- start:173 stop:439 length:267 start_codon:yes stop_codon:yes gene_type:complete